MLYLKLINENIKSTKITLHVIIIIIIIIIIICCTVHVGHAVAHLVEALRYKPEGRGFDFPKWHWKFLLT